MEVLIENHGTKWGSFQPCLPEMIISRIKIDPEKCQLLADTIVWGHTQLMSWQGLWELDGGVGKLFGGFAFVFVHPICLRWWSQLTRLGLFRAARSANQTMQIYGNTVVQDGSTRFAARCSLFFDSIYNMLYIYILYIYILAWYWLMLDIPLCVCMYVCMYVYIYISLQNIS